MTCPIEVDLTTSPRSDAVALRDYYAASIEANTAAGRTNPPSLLRRHQAAVAAVEAIEKGLFR